MGDIPTPYETGTTRASSPPTHLDYLSMDAEALKRRAIRFLIEQFPDDFNNLSESDYGIVLLEIWSFIADHISYKIDYTANQLSRQHATELDHMMRIVNLVGYHPRSPSPAKTWCSISVETPLSEDILIPSGYLVQARGEDVSVLFELYPADPSGEPILDTDIILPAGSVVNTNILALEGETRLDLFASDGNPSQRFTTSVDSVLFGSLRVWVNDTQWRNVECFPLGAENVFTLRHDSNFAAQVTFGDNTYGAIPPEEAEIRIEYRVGGGKKGNIVRGAINQNSIFPFRNGSGSAAVTITNYEAGRGGAPGESIEDLRRKTDTPIRTQNRLVTGEDYQRYAENYSSTYHGKVGKASAVLRQYGCAANIIDIYILEDDGGQDLLTPSEELIQELEKDMEAIKMLTDSICVKPGEKISQDLSIGVLSSKTYMREQGAIEQRIRDRTASFFNLDNWSFGKILRKSELLRYLAGIPEITSLDVVFESNASDIDPDPDVVEVSENQILRPGQLQISFTFE